MIARCPSCAAEVEEDAKRCPACHWDFAARRAPAKLGIDDAAAEVLKRALKLEDFFPEFTAEIAQKVFPRSGLFAYADKGSLVEQGESGRDLFIVCHGSVQVERGDGTATKVLATLGAGSLLGEIALIKNVPRTATVTAVEQAQIYRLDFNDLQYLLANNKALGDHLRELASSRSR